MKDFSYGKPSSLEQVVSFLAKGARNAFLLAGGTDLLSEIKEGTVEPDIVIDLKAIPGLSYIRKDKDGTAIGALTTVAELAEDPMIRVEYRVLSDAANAVASPQLRNVGTVGGNLCQRPRCWYYRDAAVVCSKKGGTKCYAAKGRNKYHAVIGGGICYAVYPSDLAPALISLDAKAVLVTSQGEKTVRLSDFYTPPIVNVRKENILTGQEVLKEVRIPLPRRGEKSAYIKFMERGAWDFAIVSAAAWLSQSGNRVDDIRIVCGGVGTIPWKMKSAEETLKGNGISEALIGRAAAKAAGEAIPLAENGYKVELLKTIVARAVQSAAQAPATTGR
jgi:xanthine dehydrogenase YagS FAD-binding subunit